MAVVGDGVLAVSEVDDAGFVVTAWILDVGCTLTLDEETTWTVARGIDVVEGVTGAEVTTTLSIEALVVATSLGFCVITATGVTDVFCLAVAV